MRMRARIGFAHGALMPKLRYDLPAMGMHSRDHFAPAIDGGRIPQQRNIVFAQARVANGGRVINRDPLGHDQARAAFGATTIIGRDIRGGNAIGAEAPGHRRHHDAVAQFHAANPQRLEERLPVRLLFHDHRFSFAINGFGD